MTADDAIISAYLHARGCVGDAPSQRQLAAQFGVRRARVAALVGPLSGTLTRPAVSPAQCHEKVQTRARMRPAEFARRSPAPPDAFVSVSGPPGLAALASLALVIVP